MRDKYLPIGTVVLLKGGKKRAMITGFCSVAQEDQEKIYDYSGCVYPEGYLSSNQVCLFDHDQIDKIFFLGYEDEEEKSFKEKLNQIVNEIEKEGNYSPDYSSDYIEENDDDDDEFDTDEIETLNTNSSLENNVDITENSFVSEESNSNVAPSVFEPAINLTNNQESENDNNSSITTPLNQESNDSEIVPFSNM